MRLASSPASMHCRRRADGSLSARRDGSGRLRPVRSLPPALRGPIIAASGYLERARRVRSWEPPRPVGTIAPGAVVVSGLVNDVSGIGRAGRLTLDALGSHGITPVAHDLRPVILGYPDVHSDLPGGPGGIWIVHANAPETDIALQGLSPQSWANRYRIGYWVWETTAAPRSWRRTARWFHEIWTPSHYAAAALRTVLAGGSENELAARVRVVPHPVPHGAEVADRARFGLSADRFTGLVMLDGRSTLARKNPSGAVAAWMKAFPKPAADRELVVKVHAGGAETDLPDDIAGPVARRSDIRLFTAILSDRDMGVLLASIDIYISLHRSEGFGLTVFEAAARGRPVLATANSAIAEYFGTGSILAVPSVDRPVSDPSGTYRNGVWGEPDLTVAADQLREAYALWRHAGAMPKVAPPEILMRNLDQWAPGLLFPSSGALLERSGVP